MHNNSIWEMLDGRVQKDSGTRTRLVLEVKPTKHKDRSLFGLYRKPTKRKEWKWKWNIVEWRGEMGMEWSEEERSTT